MREYIVTLKNRKDLESFYKDMETEGGNLYIPNRKIPVKDRRPTSRNTHYILTDEESQILREDERVLAVELTPEEMGLKIKPCYSVSSNNWYKNSLNDSSHLNWGMLRCFEGSTRSNWGMDGTENVSGEIVLTSSGKNVDIVIVDGNIDINNPEMSVNSDGSGGSRFVNYNWFLHADEIGDSSNSGNTYSYNINVNDDGDNHGMHVAATAAGNTLGWARDANVYNINPYSGSSVNVTKLFEYIRAFHLSKDINPKTGFRNPTIVNNSWSYVIPNNLVSNVTSVTFRGVTTTKSFTATELRNNYGILTFNEGGNDYFDIPLRHTAVEADIEDAIQSGVIMVAAASNDYMKIDVEGGIDYNNTVTGGSTVYTHRGATPGSSPRVICVGAVSTLVDERKADFSNCGPRVDVWAPGHSINSSVYTGAVEDPRNVNYEMIKYNGTSMASPQVCGILACLLENYPTLTQEECLQYIIDNCNKNQLFDSGQDIGDETLYNISDSLQGSPNRYIKYFKIRKETGNSFPIQNYKPRPKSGQIYPRIKRRR